MPQIGQADGFNRQRQVLWGVSRVVVLFKEIPAFGADVVGKESISSLQVYGQRKRLWLETRLGFRDFSRNRQALVPNAKLLRITIA